MLLNCSCKTLPLLCDQLLIIFREFGTEFRARVRFYGHHSRFNVDELIHKAVNLAVLSTGFLHKFCDIVDTPVLLESKNSIVTESSKIPLCRVIILVLTFHYQGAFFLSHIAILVDKELDYIQLFGYRMLSQFAGLQEEADKSFVINYTSLN